MNGGEIFDNEILGNYTASNMRRGMGIIIKGSRGNFTSFKMISGSVLLYKCWSKFWNFNEKRFNFLMKIIKKKLREILLFWVSLIKLFLLFRMLFTK